MKNNIFSSFHFYFDGSRGKNKNKGFFAYFFLANKTLLSLL